MTGLITDPYPALRVVGLKAQDHTGADDVIPADVVILATGGYAASREVLERLQPEHSQALIGCLRHATGDGHRMLTDLGVDIVGHDTYLPTMGMVEDSDQSGYAIPRRLPESWWTQTPGCRVGAMLLSRGGPVDDMQIGEGSLCCHRLQQLVDGRAAGNGAVLGRRLRRGYERGTGPDLRVLVAGLVAANHGQVRV